MKNPSSEMARIYLDHAATTPVLPEVVDHMCHLLGTEFGNPSSIHAEGRRSRSIIEASRKSIAKYLNASLGEIFFTSGGTESNNMALQCAVRDLGVVRIISSRIEHHCILHMLDQLPVRIDWVKLDEFGRVDLEDLKRLLHEYSGPTLVSLMHVNNELGSINQLDVLSEICAEHGAFLHSDTVQGIGYFNYDLSKIKIQFISGAAHKFNGPKGVGFIYINNDHLVNPILFGGSQERNMRAGTENISGISGMSLALEKAVDEQKERSERVKDLNQYLRTLLSERIPGIRINSGDVSISHPKILSVSFPRSEKTDLLVLNLDIAGVAVSGGSACSSGVESESHVLEELGLTEGFRTVRFSFSHTNTREEIERVVEIVTGSV